VIPAFEIAGVPVRNRVLAAPMCGATKLPFRRLATRFGADLVFTEMVKATPLSRRCPKTLSLLTRGADEQNVGAQICGADETLMSLAAEVVEDLGFPLLDVNMGCPVKKVVRGGAGAALLRDPKRVEAITRACVRAVQIPVSVKIRSGWDSSSDIDASEIARAAENGGASMVSIHARDRSQRHTGDVDFGALARAKAAVSIPVIGNGGVVCGESAERMVDETGCDAVMIGRGAYGRPWVFRDVSRRLAGLAPAPELTRAEQCDLMIEHLRGMVELLGQRGVLIFRKYATWYFKGDEGPSFRDRAHRIREPEAMHQLITAWSALVREPAPLS
jgi:tRNA-dihydrouridine synthase B